MVGVVRWVETDPFGAQSGGPRGLNLLQSAFRRCDSVTGDSVVSRIGPRARLRVVCSYRAK